jgi:hypothetical protein
MTLLFPQMGPTQVVATSDTFTLIFEDLDRGHIEIVTIPRG